ncbi:MAG: hypothetical protein OEY52_10400 [Gammaproteobacteria bacterium]|nr:hypothetical protein [Gammaproteobacteria bacterium]
MSELAPKVGSWYRNLEDGRLFEVVAMDEDDGTIEIQYFESEIEELDTDTWGELVLEFTAAPEDWSGPYDDLISDDMGDTEDAHHPQNWSDPMKDFD